MLKPETSGALRALLGLGLLLAAAPAPAGEPAAGGKAGEVLAAARAEAVGLSPALEKALDWPRAELMLVNAGSAPEPWLARGTVLTLAWNLPDWPAAEQLALLRRYFADPRPELRRLVVELMSREPVVKAGALADLRAAAEKDADSAVRIGAAEELLRHGDPAGWKPLLGALYSEDPKVRAERWVQTSPHREAKEALIELSLRHWRFGENAARLPAAVRLSPEHLELAKRAWAMEDNVIRRTIAEIVGLNRDPAQAALLLEWVAKDDAWTTLRSLYISLGYLGDKAALPALAGALAKPKEKKAGRLSPAMGLAFLGDIEGLKVLVAALDAGENFPVLARALSRAFDPAFPEDSDRFLVPRGEKVSGEKVSDTFSPAWIPAASTAGAPMVADGKGGKRPAPALAPAEFAGAWKAFLDKFGPRLKWDPQACRYTLAAE